jgi:co-chaperonin GroES (HSP10)
MGEVLFDNKNAVTITDLGISLETLGDKIIVMYDHYKSGFECKECGGIGKVTEAITCECEQKGTPGLKDRFGNPCPSCDGNFESKRKELTQACPACRGKGSLLVIPEIAKSIPTTGVVVSLGEDTKFSRGDIHAKIQIGTRVIFSQHVGTMIPFKGNIKFKVMREHEPLAILYGADTDTNDFIDFETKF